MKIEILKNFKIYQNTQFTEGERRRPNSAIYQFENQTIIMTLR